MEIIISAKISRTTVYGKFNLLLWRLTLINSAYMNMYMNFSLRHWAYWVGPDTPD